MARISFFNYMTRSPQSPFAGHRQPLGLRLLAHTMFLPQVPLKASAAVTRYALRQLSQGQNIHYIFSGPPGTGKSELMKNLSEALNTNGTVIDGFACSSALEQHWQSGRVSAEHVAHLRQLRDNGEILPDIDVRGALDFMFEIRGKKPQICALDGALRTAAQIELMYGYALVHSCNIGVVELSASPDVCVHRIRDRPGAAERADTQKAVERIHAYTKHTVPAMKLAALDLGMNYVRVDTEMNSPKSTCRRVLKHLFQVMTADFSLVQVEELLRRCQANVATA
jgi:adenylate kinase family enzyme